jgi:hypothetical protein
MGWSSTPTIGEIIGGISLIVVFARYTPEVAWAFIRHLQTLTPRSFVTVASAIVGMYVLIALAVSATSELDILLGILSD